MFIGRKKEVQQLKNFFNRGTAGLAVCSGRRRIGKSTLIEHCSQSETFLEFYGLPPREGIGLIEQLEYFSSQLSGYFGLSGIQFLDWHDALMLLASLTRSGRYIILLDEISWMASEDKDFPGKLKGIWDTVFKKNPDIRIILCGSVSSWIEENIFHNKGFVGRVSLTIRLQELPLHDANQFWMGNPIVSSREKFQLLCVTGGVPRYLEEINPNINAEENIKRMCFTKGGVLVDEFEKIFFDLFRKQSSQYMSIVESLKNHPKTYEEICSILKIEPSGSIHSKLNTLIESGFVKRDFVYNKTKAAKKLSRFRLSDNYLRFYLKYIHPIKHLIEQGLYEDFHLDNLNNWSSIIGLQFENLVLNNLSSIIKKLNISPETLLSASPYFQNETKRQRGCQVDLFIQTKYTYYLCEIKFKDNIGREVIDEVMEKIHRITVPNTVSVRPVLICHGNVSSNLVTENFFSHIIHFDDLLNEE